MVFRQSTQKVWFVQCAVMGVATAGAAVSLAGVAGPRPDAIGLLAYRILVSTALILGWPAWALWALARSVGLAQASWNVEVVVLAALCMLQWFSLWAAGWVSLRKGREIPSPILLALLVGGAVVLVIFSWTTG
jgi:hypothetical protein